VGESTGQIGDWEPAVGDNNKPALMDDMVEATVSLSAETPPDGELRWPDGSTDTVRLISAQQALSDVKADGAGSCSECAPLQITGARLASISVQTSRGPAEAPAWEFSVHGTAVLVTRVAIDAGVTVVPPSLDPNAPYSISIESATVSVGGRQLTVTFTGSPGPASEPCGADYTAEAVESSIAVVVIVTEHPHGGFEACTDVGAERTAVVELSAPLGGRAVLEVREGQPVAVQVSH
jgi:hypothetical protein